MDPSFDGDCRRCARLVKFLAVVRAKNPTYHAAPVAPLGDRGAPLL
ncbi:MAG TPA: uracil-DNA glycosylase, partial [Gammaproteobacteria bacterium]|nr:uracil-DNA glycosylase [Gammaproteobacteria bacterium]